MADVEAGVPIKQFITIGIFITWVMLSLAMSMALCIVTIRVFWGLLIKGCLC